MEKKRFYSSELCARCKGRGYCGGPCKILNKIKQLQPKVKKEFTGSSPPEIFVGRFDYPNINTGILSPEQQGEMGKLASPEQWYKEKAEIDDILSFRSQMIYSRFKTNIKKSKGKLIGTLKEISIAKKSVLTEFKLKKKPYVNFSLSKHTPFIGNPAPLVSARLEENPFIEKKVDYVTGDKHARAVDGIKEMYKGKIQTSSIIKILSAGMLGRAINRRFVPTRWSITAVDDTLSKFLLERIRYYQEIDEIIVFHNEYLGNHYEFLLLPGKFEFEVIEAYMTGSVWNPSGRVALAQDNEGFFGRKKYAKNVTGAYYTARLAVCEFLEKIKRQASVLVLREERPEYYAPLGVGILRECGRDAFNKKEQKFESLGDVFNAISHRMKIPIDVFKKNSKLLKEYGKQKRLSDF